MSRDPRPADPREQRLRELATKEAQQVHQIRVDGITYDALMYDGHDGEFAVCPHSDCVLVRAEAPRVEPLHSLSPTLSDESPASTDCR